ncbi:MAG: uridine kinase, partial [Planctomycetota bacterium]
MTRSQTSMLAEPYVVAIAGASGSGKSCLAERLRDRLSATDGSQHVRMLCEDAYYRDRSDLTYEQRSGINYDHPDSLEHKLLVDHLDALRAGSAIEAPSYDYATHNRRTSTETIEPCRILLLEGILLLSQPAIRERCDLKLFVDVPLDVCLSRRVRRDVL